MKIRIRLFGTLRKDFPDVEAAAGFELEITENANVSDLLAQLSIGGSRRAVAAINGRIMKPDDTLKSGDTVHVFESVFGG